MSLPSVVYVNGHALANGEVPTVSLFDRGYLLGDSIFATMRYINGRVFRWDHHLTRLRSATDWARYSLGPTDEELGRVVHEAGRRVQGSDVTLRLTVSRGVGPPGARSDTPIEATWSVFARPTTLAPASAYRDGIDTAIVGTPRIPRRCMPSEHKIGNYVSSLTALREAASIGAIEGIQTSIDGRLSSGCMSNLFLVVGDELHTPSLDSDCRPGVTREVLLELAAEAGIRSVERDLLPEDLPSAREAFFASTLIDVLPIRSIGSRATFKSTAFCAELRHRLVELRTR